MKKLSKQTKDGYSTNLDDFCYFFGFLLATTTIHQLFAKQSFRSGLY